MKKTSGYLILKIRKEFFITLTSEFGQGPSKNTRDVTVAVRFGVGDVHAAVQLQVDGENVFAETLRHRGQSDRTHLRKVR
jgi:hypothetical protein